MKCYTDASAKLHCSRAKPEVLKDVEKQVQMVRESLKVAQTRQKSYVDKRRRDLSFGVGDFYTLRSPL
jgi:hypothetical protein